MAQGSLKSTLISASFLDIFMLQSRADYSREPWTMGWGQRPADPGGTVSLHAVGVLGVRCQDFGLGAVLGFRWCSIAGSS